MKNIHIRMYIRLYSTNTAIAMMTLRMDMMMPRESIRTNMSIPPRSMSTITRPIFITGTGMRDEEAMKDQFTLGVFAIIYDEQKNILLAHRRDMDLWDLPGGGMNHGELPTDTAIREAKEETGFDVVIDRLL